jgi:hypothetical protein
VSAGSAYRTAGPVPLGPTLAFRSGMMTGPARITGHIGKTTATFEGIIRSGVLTYRADSVGKDRCSQDSHGIAHVIPNPLPRSVEPFGYLSIGMPSEIGEDDGVALWIR